MTSAAVVPLPAAESASARIDLRGKMTVFPYGITELRRGSHLPQKLRVGRAGGRCRRRRGGRCRRCRKVLRESEKLAPGFIDGTGITPVGLVNLGDVSVVKDTRNRLSGH